MTDGYISTIQEYATKDGPGLRSTVFLKWCNLACKWCSNPELQKPDGEVYFFPERIKDPDLALAENPGLLSRDGDTWKIDRAAIGDHEELIERNTQPIFEEVAGKISVEECVDKLLRNQAFYEASDGGVTFSGGEAMLQVNFVAACLQRLTEHGVHTTIDTAGDVPWHYFEKVLPYTDLFLYDIKTADPELHHRLTGVNNKRILDNAHRLAAAGAKMWIRMVLVPGQNDLIDDLRARLDIAAELGEAVERVDLLGYHSLGVGKYSRLDSAYSLHEVPGVDDDVLKQVFAHADQLGLPLHYEPGITV